MKIIKSGKKPSNLERFTCPNCGCVFECADDEHWEDKNTLYGYKRIMTCCPECHKVCESSKTDITWTGGSVTIPYTWTSDTLNVKSDSYVGNSVTAVSSISKSPYTDITITGSAITAESNTIKNKKK